MLNVAEPRRWPDEFFELPPRQPPGRGYVKRPSRNAARGCVVCLALELGLANYWQRIRRQHQIASGGEAN
jgi:hypothetical protein